MFWIRYIPFIYRCLLESLLSDLFSQDNFVGHQSDRKCNVDLLGNLRCYLQLRHHGFIMLHDGGMTFCYLATLHILVRIG